MRKLLDDRGVSTTVFAIFLPVILAFIALCVDGATLIYYRISLETAADAASLAGIDAYDRQIWSSEQRVVLIQYKAEELAREILHDNMPEAELIAVEIPFDSPNTCRLEAKVEAPLHFLKLFGIDARTIWVVSLAHGYS